MEYWAKQGIKVQEAQGFWGLKRIFSGIETDNRAEQ
jgi:hypothetical protein